MELAWCFDIPGEKGVVAGRETVVFALRERPEGLVSFGLGGCSNGTGRPRPRGLPKGAPRPTETSPSRALFRAEGPRKRFAGRLPRRPDVSGAGAPRGMFPSARDKPAVTLNTDDPPMFGATLDGEYVAVAETLGLTAAEIALFAKNAVEASFPPSADKTALLREIDEILLQDPELLA
nr:hypothetical protein [Amycolatopsis sp. CB00013]